MKLRSIRKLPRCRDKRVLVRANFDIALPSGTFEASDLFRLKTSLPTVQYLIRRKAAVILMAHRGRPNGVDHSLSLKVIAQKFSKLLGKPVEFWDGDLDECTQKSTKLRGGRVACIENLRFSPGETDNSAAFARQLAGLGDYYVNDAFGNSHRAHASMVGVPRMMQAFAGDRLVYEVENLGGLLRRARKPVIAVIGGGKISTKIRLIKKLMRSVDYVLLGGALANNVLAAMEHPVGKSKVEQDMIEWSKGLLNNKLKVPLDARVATSLTATPRISAVGKVRDNEIILDIGPDTTMLYEKILRTAATVIWNGPLGYFEDKRYAIATNEIVDMLASLRARSFVGGGETVKAVIDRGAEEKLHFVSTGGGAMLELIEGRSMPGLRPLKMRS